MQGSRRIGAVDAAAAAAGVRPGITLADARAVCPNLRVGDADPAGDARALARLAGWCERYSPWAATDGADGLVLDTTGTAHLFADPAVEDDEAALIADLTDRLDRLGIAARTAAADNPAAAWAWARFGNADDPVLAPGGARAALAPLPAAALRLPEDTVAGLGRMGLRRIGDLYDLPRAPLAARFGAVVGRRLDLALGAEAAPISPARPAPAFRVRIAWPEPIGSLAAVEAATAALLERLAALLEAAGQGARRLELTLYRVDGTLARRAIGTARPARGARHLLSLFAEKLADLDLGFGVEAMILAARVTETLAPRQAGLAPGGARADEESGGALARLVDRLENRLGPGNVVRLVPVDSHIPERAVTVEPALGPPTDAEWAAAQPRPLRLLPCPEPIEAMAPVPDDPPVWFRWRRVVHRVARAEGPERIAPEWWRVASDPARGAGRAGGPAARVRDYYRLEDGEGRRFWVYRAGLYRADADDDAPAPPPAWYMHGLFP